MIKRHCMVVHAYYPLGETRVEREALALLRRATEQGEESVAAALRDSYSAEFVDEPRLFGPSRNPWSADRTTGGSSGGWRIIVLAELQKC